jgi:hypothetical protein
VGVRRLVVVVRRLAVVVRRLVVVVRRLPEELSPVVVGAAEQPEVRGGVVVPAGKKRFIVNMPTISKLDLYAGYAGYIDNLDTLIHFLIAYLRSIVITSYHKMHN